VTDCFLRQFARQQDGTFYNSTIFAEAFLDPLYPSFKRKTIRSSAIYGHPLNSRLTMGNSHRVAPCITFARSSGLPLQVGSRSLLRRSMDSQQEPFQQIPASILRSKDLRFLHKQSLVNDTSNPHRTRLLSFSQTHR